MIKTIDGAAFSRMYRNMLPPDYDSWYAPLLAQGVTDMPDSFETAK